MDRLSSFANATLGLSATTAYDLNVAQVCLRALVVFAALLFLVRIAKKRFLGEATGLDVVLFIVIGSIASRAISGTAPFFESLAGTGALMAAHWVVSFFARDSQLVSSITMGHETVLIRNGRVDRKALRAAHMSANDLAEDLRQEGVEEPREVKLAILERSGKLSVIKRK